jgi:hypothetical protein
MSSQVTREASSTLYDSRKVPRAKGIGYPSCNTELALLPSNTKDPHGYYRDLGVDPGISMDKLRKFIRNTLRQLHPDTGNGDVATFNWVRNVSKVLLDPIAREKYNRTPPGMRLMDAVYEAELSKLDEFQTMDEEELKRVFAPKKAPKNPYATSLGDRYDYFAIDAHTDPWQADGLKAQLWYHFLVEAAPMVNYKRVIKVLMTSGDAEYHHDVSIMVIPRRWEPSSGLAMSLFTHVAGFRPGRNDPETRLGFVRPPMSV